MYRCLYISFMHAQPINSDKQHWLHCISKCHEELNLFIVSIAIEFNKSAKGAHKGCSPIAAQTHTRTHTYTYCATLTKLQALLTVNATVCLWLQQSNCNTHRGTQRRCCAHSSLGCHVNTRMLHIIMQTLVKVILCCCLCLE